MNEPPVPFNWIRPAETFRVTGESITTDFAPITLTLVSRKVSALAGAAANASKAVVANNNFLIIVS